MTSATPSTARGLPTLRDDLLLTEADPDPTGAPTWRIYDPLRHRYIAINRVAREALTLWPHCNSLDQLAVALRARLKSDVAQDDIEHLQRFLVQNSLVIAAGQDWRQRHAQIEAAHGSIWSRAIHSYLFFRFPLFDPRALLAWLAPWVAPLFRRGTAAMVALIGLVALSLVARQWDVFVGEARALMTPFGLALFGVTLFVVKMVHELGHAVVAHRYGCRVPVVGVAVMMGAPLLYTDVTDAWRLKRWQDRVKIDAAGMAVEVLLAIVATVFWLFLPEGTLRTVAFLVATTSWIMSIAINLNPFMKFDGYYILSDCIGVENLQPRAMELGTWALRRFLFGLRAPSPEPELSRALHAGVVAYAWGLWLYRVIMFTGIALLVYHAFFKVLGLALFAFEIVYFLVRPIVQELRAWIGMRTEIMAQPRARVTAVAAGAVLFALLVPWSSSVRGPGYVEALETGRIFAKRPGRVAEIAVREGASVVAGQLIARIDAPDLLHELRLVEARLKAVEIRIARAVANDQDRSEQPVLLSMQAALVEKRAGLRREVADLDIRAPFDGVMRELDQTLQIGQWISTRDQFGLVTTPGALSAVAYVRETDVMRLKTGATAIFIADAADGGRLHARVEKIATANTANVSAPELTVPFGGDIELAQDTRTKNQKPLTPVYRVDLAMEPTAASVPMRLRGTIHMAAEPESLIAAAARRIIQVIIRESGT